jgi:uncharacterized protein YecE (DUF72 family)
MEGYTVAIEFRSSSWLDERHVASTLALLRHSRLVHVIVDAPADVSNRAHTVWEATHPDLALVRLHGRNAATWNGAESAAARFDYDYGDDELSDLAGSIRSIAASVGTTHVIFNNCFEDEGQRNATTMMSILGKDAVQAGAT